ncbi:MAG: leucine-rich repeat domain-containing protein [Aureispira sp.]|nr:leucine-rich repeat domain-containing protein [Aureispira sp.]
MRGLINILILVLFCEAISFAQTITIPDTAFEQKLIALGIDSDGQVNGQILNSDALVITTLSVSFSGITDLTGIEAFTNLRVLNCNGNQLGSLSLSNNTALRNLNCNSNLISSLNLSNNTALEDLYCQDNQLTNLDVTNNIALENLYCYRNQLSSLDVTNNLVLEEMYCYHNQLSDIDVRNNTALTDFRCDNNQLNDVNLANNIALTFFSCDNNQLSYLDLRNNSVLAALYSEHNRPFMQICVVDDQAAINNSNWNKDPNAFYLENCYPLAVEGRVVFDTNSNCQVDSLENGYIGQFLKFEKGAKVVYTSTYDTLGNYKAFLDTGTYTITVLPSTLYMQSCLSSQQVTVDTNYTLQQVDWALEATTLCSYLEVDISAPFLRQTGGGSSYTVSYCNNGTAMASNAYVEIDLDTALNVLGTSIPIASQIGSFYTFNIGNLAVGECGDFTITTIVDAGAQFEQTHCTEAHIYPDTVCLPIWAGPIAQASAICQNDTVYFKIGNTGSPMLQSQQYFVFEDNVIMRTGTVQLGTNQFTNIVQAAAAGKTYRIEVEQLAGFPALLGDLVAMASVEGCNPLSDGTFSTGFITQLSNGNSSPFIAVDCQQNVGSYDPNDKAAQPAGYGVAHYIYKNTAIDYKIRFQNTGTDTAFNIVILDTLSPHVDITSLIMGASSHNYTWTIQDGNVLRLKTSEKSFNSFK